MLDLEELKAESKRDDLRPVHIKFKYETLLALDAIKNELQCSRSDLIRQIVAVGARQLLKELEDKSGGVIDPMLYPVTLD